MDALTELLEYRKPHGLSPLGKRFSAFHKLNPHVLDFFIQELVTLRENGWKKTSFGSLWHHARWVLSTLGRAPGETFAMPQNFACHYARAIIILHPEFNGFFEMMKSQADADLGTVLEPTSKPGRIRRLLWADGASIEQGWRPSAHHVPKPVSRRDRVKRAKAMKRK
ncbi:MAG: hypothetical protein WBZ01_17830 [Terriglobales bacterium]|jgi:hypothetical protein